jgi:hypothetical protein
LRRSICLSAGYPEPAGLNEAAELRFLHRRAAPHLAERRRSQIEVRMRGGSRVTTDLPTASQLLSLSPVVAFFNRDTSRRRSVLLRFHGRPRPFRTMRAKSWRSLSLSVSFTRSRALIHRDLETSHTTAHWTARPRAQTLLIEGIQPHLGLSDSDLPDSADTRGQTLKTTRRGVHRAGRLQHPLPGKGLVPRYPRRKEKSG